MFKTKNIWLINQYASTPETGMGGRHYYLARELARQGHNVYLIAAGYTHLLRKPPELSDPVEIIKQDGFNMVWIRLPSYSRAHSKARILNWFRFAWALRSLKDFIPDRPASILYSSPGLIGFLGAKYLAGKFGSKLIFEVRDIWPLTLQLLGGYSAKHPFIRFLRWVELDAYKKADKVVSNLPNAIEHFESSGMNPEKFSWVPNGFLKSEIDAPQPLREEVLKQLPLSKFIVGYTGTIGVANAIENLVQAADLLRDKNDIAFVIVGAGQDKASLRELVAIKGLENVFFIEPIRKVEIQTMLSCFDVCYIGWLRDELYKFGIGSNKIPEYLVSGKPIIHAYSGACDPVLLAGAGVTVAAEDPSALAKAIVELYAMSSDKCLSMGNNGRRVAYAEYDYEILAKKLSKILLSS